MDNVQAQALLTDLHRAAFEDMKLQKNQPRRGRIEKQTSIGLVVCRIDEQDYKSVRTTWQLRGGNVARNRLLVMLTAPKV